MNIVLTPENEKIIAAFLTQLAKGMTNGETITISASSAATPTPTPSRTRPAVTQSPTPSAAKPTPSNTPSKSAPVTPSPTPSKSSPAASPTPSTTRSATPTPSTTRPAISPSGTPRPTPTPSTTATAGGSTGTSILQHDLSYVDLTSNAFDKFKSICDRNDPDDVGAFDQVCMYRLTGNQGYATKAIAYAEQQVAQAEADIAAGRNPDVADDSYLYVSNKITDLAFTYAFCNNLLSASQKTRWKAYADQTIFNIWNYQQASWGGRSAPWSGWSVNDPGNNYYYSFLQATITWALATNNTAYISFLQNDRIPLVANYYATLPGGGTREGTNYGLHVAQLFDAMRFWKDSGFGDPMNAASNWITDDMKWWIHCTAPTMDYVGPMGDQSRVSVPEMYDYNRAIVLKGRRFVTDPNVLDDTSWWLHNISVSEMGSRFNYFDDLNPAGSGGTPPAELTYYASGTGCLFSRTAWTPNATWLIYTAGIFDQSHQHEEHGGFTFYKNDWLSVSANIWSHSGIEQNTYTNNVLRFVKGGNTIHQMRDNAATMSITSTGPNGEVHATSDQTALYEGAINSWKRNIDFVGGVLTVHDTYSTDAQTQTYFQVCTPVQPTRNGNVITAGNLKVTVTTPSNPTIALVDMRTVDSDFQSGWRIDISGATGEFLVKLESTV